MNIRAYPASAMLAHAADSACDVRRNLASSGREASRLQAHVGPAACHCAGHSAGELAADLVPRRGTTSPCVTEKVRENVRGAADMVGQWSLGAHQREHAYLVVMRWAGHAGDERRARMAGAPVPARQPVSFAPLACGCARRCGPRLPGALQRGGLAGRGHGGCRAGWCAGEVRASRSGGQGRSRVQRPGPGPGASRAWRRSAWRSRSPGGRRDNMTPPRRPPPRPGTCRSGPARGRPPSNRRAG
jgi:hypothetical protein